MPWLADDEALSLVKLYSSRPLPALAGSGRGTLFYAMCAIKAEEVQSINCTL